MAFSSQYEFSFTKIDFTSQEKREREKLAVKLYFRKGQFPFHQVKLFTRSVFYG